MKHNIAHIIAIYYWPFSGGSWVHSSKPVQYISLARLGTSSLMFLNEKWVSNYLSYNLVAQSLNRHVTITLIKTINFSLFPIKYCFVVFPLGKVSVNFAYMLATLTMTGKHSYDSPGASEASWWRHQMETFSASLVLCAGNSPVTGEFTPQRPLTRSFDVFFHLRLKKRLSKQSIPRSFETSQCSLWRHCSVHIHYG